MSLLTVHQNNDRQLNAHMYAPTVTFARWRSVCEFATPDHGALRLQPKTAPWNWVVQWVVDISMF